MTQQLRSEGFLRLVNYGNNFHLGSTKKNCKPFYIGETQVGLIRPDFWELLKEYPDVFCLQDEKDEKNTGSVFLASHLKSYEERSQAMNKVLEDLRQKHLCQAALKGWRDECYNVYGSFACPPLLKMERSATSLLGVKQYGVHINGYLRHPDKGMCMWIGRRSKHKATYPGKLDQLAAGGLAEGYNILENARKESEEEASIPSHLLDKLQPAGAISYFYEDERGLFPENQFIYDLEVPSDFIPVNADGEVESFELIPISEIYDLMVTDAFKFNCSLVVMDFLIRHGFIKPDEEPQYSYLLEQLHRSPGY